MIHMKKQSIARVRKKRQKLLESAKLPADALPGSLTESRFRCGKSNCHCYQSSRHVKWVLTYMHQGKKRMRHIPADLVESVRRNLAEGKRFKETVNEIFGANAELLGALQQESKE